jgi:elongation factor P--beta-lysine ligase
VPIAAHAAPTKSDDRAQRRLQLLLKMHGTVAGWHTRRAARRDARRFQTEQDASLKMSISPKRQVEL